MDSGRSRRIADVEAILRAAIAAADPAPAVSAAIARSPELNEARSVHILAIGKAAVRMSHAACADIAEQVGSCLVIAPHGTEPLAPRGCRLITAAHPIPDDASLHAGRAAADMLRNASRDDVVLALISGGASALCILPVQGLTLADHARIVRSLLQAGADIHELNAVRRQIDLLKGGGMASLAAPARTVGLVVSDVPGDDLDVIASGPLTASRTDAADARRVLERYGMAGEHVGAALHAKSAVPPEVFELVRTEIVLSNADARRGAAACAHELGYATVILDEPVTGEARVQGEAFADRIAQLEPHADTPLCIIAGGETTVTVRGPGRGGRNQELVLAAALRVPPDSRVAIGSVGTDGIDGPTDAAGAVADGTLRERGERIGLDASAALSANDSWTFFQRVGGLVHTGATGTNVMDVMVAARRG